MKKKYFLNSILFVITIGLLFCSCGSGEDIYAIEDALQEEWDISNSMSVVGAVDCNVFSVKVDKVEGSTVYVSYSLKSQYAYGKKIVKFEGAKLTKTSNGNYKVESTGY